MVIYFSKKLQHHIPTWIGRQKEKKEKKQSWVIFQLYDRIIGLKFWIPTHFKKTTDN